jgi:Raf kinase inhibitor-like YbhB/YbcL family protein
MGWVLALARTTAQPAVRRLGVAGLVGLALALLAVACGHDGYELQRPTPEQTTTSATPTTVADSSASPLRLTSPAFAEGAPIPAEFTCTGADVSPPLAWTDVPAGTVELALVVRDPDADGFVHWVVAGLAPSTGGLAQGNTPDAATQARNDFGRLGWSGPCPPSGTHHYEFRLYALSAPSGVEQGSDAAAAAQQVETASIVASAALSGTVTAP